MTVHLLKNLWSRGEFSPKSRSRVDLEQYAGGAEILRNAIAVPQGGIRRRSGTRFFGSTKFPEREVAFIPFVFTSTGDTYILEFGDLYIRFWTRNGQIADPINPTIPYEIASVYTHDEVQQIQFVQVGNVLYLAHERHYPRTLTRNSHQSWTLANFPFVDGPYYPINDTTTSVTGSAAYDEGTTTTLTFSSVNGINNNTGFNAGDVGRHVRVKPSGGRWIYGTISVVTDTTHVNVLWVRVGDGTSSGDDVTTAGGTFGTATKSWRLGSITATPAAAAAQFPFQFPACVEVFESRLIWANTADQPRTLWASRTGLPADYAPSTGDGTVSADHGFHLTILAGRADEILWLREAPRLQIGTSAGIRTIGASDTVQALSSTNVSQRLEISYGVNEVPPAHTGDANIAAARFGRAVRHVYFDYQVNSIVAPDISRLHEHLFTGGIKKLVYQQVPEGIVWALMEDCTVVGITFDQQERIVAYHRHDFGDDALVTDIEVIPGSTRDELWLSVVRFINGAQVRYVEQLEQDFDPVIDALEEAFFVDCGLTYDDAPTNAIAGLTHLADQDVIALADGVVIRNLHIDVNGILVLPDGREASKIHVGKVITTEFKTLRPPHQQEDGWILGRSQRVAQATVEVIATGGLSVGSRPEAVQPIQNRLGGTPFGVPTPLKDGVYEVPVQDRWEDGGQVYGVITDPLPGFVRSILIRLDAETSR